MLPKRFASFLRRLVSLISIAIMGAGRMGSLIRQTAEAMRDENQDPVFRVVTQIGFDLAALQEAPKADVLVDFSNAATLPAVETYVKRCRCALVSGTTGYTADEMDRLQSLSRDAAILHSGNYSIGIAALRHLTAQAVRELPGFDVEICEIHHNQKVDTPSGTAEMLLDTIRNAQSASGRGDYRPVFERNGICGARDPREVGMHSLRGGTVAGVHTVSLFGPDEEIALTHRAESRQIFVNGALAATLRMAGRAPGLYTFDGVMFS